MANIVVETLEEYLQKKEQKRFSDSEGTSEAYNKFVDCVSDRAEWDEQAQMANNVQRNDFSYLSGDVAEKTKIYCANYVKRDIEFRFNQLVTSDVEIDLKTEDGYLTPAMEMLETEMNFLADRVDIADKARNVIHNTLYTGEAVQHQNWDVSEWDKNYLTGKPKFENIASSNFWRDPATLEEDKSDCRYIFVKRTYDTELLKEMFADNPEIDKIQPSELDVFGSSNYYRNQTANNLKTTDVLVYQYKRAYYIDIIGIANEIDNKIEFFTKDEVMEYLKEKGSIDLRDAQQYDANDVFPEGMRATDVLEKKKCEYVYEVVFIPEFDLILQEPTIVGKEFTYVTMSYWYDPNSAYSYGLVKDNLDLLEASAILLTLQLYEAVKSYKSIPLIAPGAIINDKDFLENYYKPGVKAILSEQWAKDNPNTPAIQWIMPPERTSMMEMLQQSLENKIDQQMAAPAVSRGVSDSASDSGRSIGLKQAAASGMIRGDFYMLEKFFKKHMEILKYNICKYRVYPHNVLDITGNLVEVNGSEQLSYKGIDQDTISTVRLIDNTESAKISREQKYMGLYNAGAISYEDFMYNMNLNNPEKLIQNNQQYQADKQLAFAINSNPVIRQRVDMMLQQGQLQAVSNEEYNKSQPK